MSLHNTYSPFSFYARKLSEKGLSEVANYRQSNNGNLFRIIVTPAALLCVIFRKTVFQWIAVVALGVWLGILLISTLKKAAKHRKQRRAEAKLAKLNSSMKTDSVPEELIPEEELFLIRQVNIRITEQLKAMYPMVSWLWIRRPTVEELCSGGVWRIQTSNTEPFNYGEVAISKTGSLSITMLQAIPLGETMELLDGDDLTPEEMLDRTPVREWYSKEGGKLLSELIDDLNTQGHKHILVRENGDVCIGSPGSETTVDTIAHFPPRFAWDEFTQLLSEDEITAKAQPEGLMLSW